ncbi:CYTH domain-containing protein [Shewanella glacialimarina]|jgi:adenylate cyclase|uniref:CYTH domain-containing protein n=1 Tax=Shewanella glacialimarina TaxID=2590884 RepID=UPI001CF85549|nr:CYTH domain-containing protein [Shewanella glacialimarina]UCX03170.1 CYTH domain-containing protein [Shewanella glacialimarina]
MTVEIERKYLVHNDQFKSLAHRSTRIVQGYLNSEKSRTVRVRIMGDQGFLTIKGISNQAGLSRFEWEKEISVQEAQDLLKLCEQGVIDKTRYLVEYQNQVFEVDEFYGDNQGLVVAELELESEQQVVIKPDWLGEEVTGDNRYYNSSLMKQPYSQWA